MNTPEQSAIDIIWVILFKIIGTVVVPLMLLLGNVFRILFLSLSKFNRKV